MSQLLKIHDEVFNNEKPLTVFWLSLKWNLLLFYIAVINRLKRLLKQKLLGIYYESGMLIVDCLVGYQIKSRDLFMTQKNETIYSLSSTSLALSYEMLRGIK